MSGAQERTEPVVRLRGLHKRFHECLALADLDLELRGAQIVGVVGPDGAGKTTLIRTLAGLLEIEATEAEVLGHDLRGDVRPLKRELGYVPQAFSLHRELSVAENLRFTARLHHIPTATFAERAGRLLERTSLRPFADRPAGALSGGMKQKLAIINALLPEPRLLLLDEPTAGVDVVARAEIWNMLAERRNDMMIVISTSYLDETAACERLVYLDGGRLVADGTPAELRASVDLELYRAWGPDCRGIARRARRLEYVASSHASGVSTRIEVRRSHSPGPTHVLRDLAALRGAGVTMVEELPVDMEATLLALARRSIP